MSMKNLPKIVEVPINCHLNVVNQICLYLVLMPCEIYLFKLSVTHGKFCRWCLFSSVFSSFPPKLQFLLSRPPNLIAPSSKKIDLISSMLNKRGSFMYSVLGQGKQRCRSLE